jgi:hypothetical protein
VEEYMTNLNRQIPGDLQKKVEGFEPALHISDVSTLIETGNRNAQVYGYAVENYTEWAASL